MANAKLKLSPGKCALFQTRVKYLGHVVDAESISPDPEKVYAIKSWPRPATATEVKSSLGLCSYYCHFIPSFADIADPLHQCCSVVPFRWTSEADDSFQQLKVALTKVPILAYPVPDAVFLLDTDASGTGIGAVLSQVSSTDGHERVIAYFSRTLTERCYCVTQREVLAMVRSVKHFHAYLYGRRFLLCTDDHSALQWLLNFRYPEGQIARWIESLQQYDFTVEHRPGPKHGNTDALFQTTLFKRCV